ncbi:2,3-bisphosphoglycerate-independent phosphoglycerate mutase [Tetrabaena socialis]|uniref:2,3-bisphosphoglycerate-independent phosphoglycerate mutase n=1 Tax=Tetrabaena socialis TaxID=47790 RepID=A0A2J8AJQ6_9CHLO|nr:2,3-bisphosphoglycerate-independent phosphoglycerate mutase [Tetrabaena socialis]|eukprot:PNH12755.1 2,3-bisphosphoglycerate-independent phosphoglycerate mutase [Tetrabaena socialis]
MAQPARVLFLLVDGIGDVSIPEFGDRTPLEAAHVPHLDAIAAGGLTGLMDPVEPGLACGSDTAHMSLFGYDPRMWATFKDARRKAAWAGRPWDPAMPAEVFGPWRDPWPQAVRGDPVRSFDEVSVARGGLGRFPGSQVMGLVKQVAGV